MLKINIQEYIVEIEQQDRIGEVFVKNRLNLIHGVQGSGKSYGCLKALNADGITPIHVNLDDSTGLEELNTYNVRDKFMVEFLKCHFDRDDFVDEVVVIDTYTRFEAEVFERKGITTRLGLFNLLEGAIDYYDNVTIIMVGHTAPFVGRDGIFNDSLELVRGCAEELWLEKTLYKATKANPSRVEYNLHIQKGRGYVDERMIANWQR